MGALRQGEPAAARDLFRQAAAANAGDASIWLGLAFAHARLGESDATLDAVDKALELEPRNLRALIFKGDHLAEQGQSRRALVFYKAALKLAAQQSDIPPDIKSGLARAQAACERFAGEYEDYLLQELAT